MEYVKRKQYYNKKEFMEIINFLLKKGADPPVTNKHKNILSAIICSSTNTESIQLLSQSYALEKDMKKVNIYLRYLRIGNHNDKNFNINRACEEVKNTTHQRYKPPRYKATPKDIAMTITFLLLEHEVELADINWQEHITLNFVKKLHEDDLALEFIQLLLENGADSTIKLYNSRLLDIAFEMEDADIIDLVLEYMQSD